MHAASGPLVLTDPVYRAHPLGALERTAASLIRDPRDLPFVWLIATISVLVVPAAAMLIVDPMFSWWTAGAYLLFVTGCCYLPVLVMYHDIAHRPLFKRRYAFLKHYLNWVLGPLFGLFPNSYYAHHVAMHHAENNLRPDLSSTMHYQRDSLTDFLRYIGNFVAGVYCRLPVYLWRRKRYRLVRQVLIGELTYFAVIALIGWFNWKAALVVFVIPLSAAMIGFCCTNWTEHAFIDNAAPQNIYRSAIVCLNTIYNRVAFNDGYHVGHHLRPNLHWTQMPQEFLNGRAVYAREGALIFQGLNYYSILFLLMIKRYDVLARYCVDLEGRRSLAETIALLQQRTARFWGRDGERTLLRNERCAGIRILTQ